MKTEELEKILKDLLKEECIDEAKKILSLSSEIEIKVFVEYANGELQNIACMFLDTLKDKLVEKGKMEKGGFFGLTSSLE